jgi:hypothetical protein
MTTILLVALASLAVYVGVRRRRHRCIHNDPLCRRERPCIACYRELYEGIVFRPDDAGGGWSCNRR